METRYESHGIHVFKMFNELWDALLECAIHFDGEITCVLDALDECEEHDRHLLMTALSEFYSAANQESTKSGVLKFLVTSRPHSDIKYGLWFYDESNLIRFDADEKHDMLAGEINQAIKSMILTTAPRLPIKFHDETVKFLQHAKNHTYLWLHLTLKEMNRKLGGNCTMRRLKELFANRPSTIDEAYSQMLSESHDAQLTEKLLSIAVAARRPLSIAEIKIALELTRHDYNGGSVTDIDVESDESFQDSLQDLCGSLLTVRDLKVYFLHQTARDFLIGQSQSRESSSWPWKQSIISFDSELLLIAACLSYLALLDRNISSSSSRGSLVIPLGRKFEALRKILQKYPFLRYSAEHWLEHYQLLEDRLPSGLIERVDTILRHPLQYTLWFIVYSAQSKIDTSAQNVVFFAKLGLHTLVQTSIRNGFNVDYYDSVYGTALMVASQFGYEHVVRVLLDSQASVNIVCARGQGTALHFAAALGNGNIVRLLLHNMADINARDQCEKTALHTAVRKGNLAVINILLENGAEINAKDQWEETALHMAVRKGSLAVINILLENGAYINAGSRGHPSVLHIAVSGNSTDSIRLLLQNGADINAKDVWGKTLLHNAVRANSLEAVRLLFQHQIDINRVDNEGKTPLDVAVEAGAGGIVEFLAQNGGIEQYNVSYDQEYRGCGYYRKMNVIDINKFLAQAAKMDTGTQDRWQRIALENSIRWWRWNIAQAILAHTGKEILESMKPRFLHIAVQERREESLQKIIELGVNVDMQDDNGRTALHEAVMSGNAAAVSVLLDNRASVDIEDSYKLTPLRIASAKGHVGIMRLLLMYGAEK